MFFCRVSSFLLIHTSSEENNLCWLQTESNSELISGRLKGSANKAYMCI